MVSRAWFENLVKDYLVSIPILGLLLVIFVLKHNLDLVEVRTTWGPTPEESNWEYGFETREPWFEDGIKWHKVHTLCWAGKLYSRIGDRNIMKCREPAHKVWMSVFSLGLL